MICPKHQTPMVAALRLWRRSVNRCDACVEESRVKLAKSRKSNGHPFSYSHARINQRVSPKVAWTAALIVAVGFLAMIAPALARDDGRYAQSPLHNWFNNLKSAKGLCCSFADGVTIRDVDWDTDEGHYRVRLEGEWIVVPDEAVIREPNRAGQPIVWPYKGDKGKTEIRCFIAGTLS